MRSLTSLASTLGGALMPTQCMTIGYTRRMSVTSIMLREEGGGILIHVSYNLVHVYRYPSTGRAVYLCLCVDPSLGTWVGPS